MTVLSHSSRNTNSQAWQSFFFFLYRPLNVLFLNQAMKVAKVLDHICLTSSLLYCMKIFCLFASSHTQSYIIIIIDLIWNCISAFNHRLSHTFSNVRNIHLKQATQKITKLAVISKVISKNYKSRTFVRQSPVYHRSSDLVK